MGYCVFQPEEDFDEYQKFHTLMSAINASLGNFHGRMQIRSINKQLVSVNGELKHLSDHDYMTGLMNRRGFYSELARVIKTKKGSDSLVVVISADLDGLKEINDNYGHDMGDVVLKEVGKRLMNLGQERCTAIRIGGDEFLVIFRNASSASAIENVGKLICSKMDEPIEAHVVTEERGEQHETFTISASNSSLSILLIRLLAFLWVVI